MIRQQSPGLSRRLLVSYLPVMRREGAEGSVEGVEDGTSSKCRDAENDETFCDVNRSLFEPFGPSPF